MRIEFTTNEVGYIDYFISNQILLEGKLEGENQNLRGEVKFQFEIDEKDYTGQITLRKNEGIILFKDLLPESLSLGSAYSSYSSSRDNGIIHYLNDFLINYLADLTPKSSNLYKLKILFSENEMKILDEHFQEILEINKTFELKYVVFDSEKKIMGMKNQNKWCNMYYLLDFEKGEGKLLYVAKNLTKEIKKHHFFNNKESKSPRDSYFWRLGKIYKNHYETIKERKRKKKEEKEQEEKEQEEKDDRFLFSPTYKSFELEAKGEKIASHLWSQENFLKRMLPYINKIRLNSYWGVGDGVKLSIGNSRILIGDKGVDFNFKPKDIWRIRNNYEEYKVLCDLIFHINENKNLSAISGLDENKDFQYEELSLEIEISTEEKNLKSFIRDFDLKTAKEGVVMIGGSDTFKFKIDYPSLFILIPINIDQKIKNEQDTIIEKLRTREYLNITL